MKKPSYTLAEINQGFVVAINMEAHPGDGDKLAAVLQSLVPPSSAEPGMKIFQPYRSPSDPLKFFVFELYVNEAAWGAHQETAHFEAVVGDILRFAAKRERVPFIPYT